jgi:hypothetical protein
MSTTAETETQTEEPTAGDDLEQEAPDTPEGHLIDPAVYETEELSLPKIDGEGVDKIAAKFAGTVFLDRSDPRDVALIRELRLGQSVTLMVEATVGPPVPGYTTSKEGDLDALILSRRFSVEGVYKAVVPER